MRHFMIRSFLLPPVMGAGLSACFTEAFPLNDSTGSSGSSSSTGPPGTTSVGTPSSGDSSETTDGVESGEDPGIIPGNEYAPQILRPPRHGILAATRAFVSWEDGALPEGRTLAGYDVCWTIG